MASDPTHFNAPSKCWNNGNGNHVWGAAGKCIYCHAERPQNAQQRKTLLLIVEAWEREHGEITDEELQRAIEGMGLR